jgi:membrane associated rhomboid family serine protease
MNQAPPKLQPALFGGLFIGVLSALPIINIANCCCLWIIGGGVLATYLMQQNHPYAIATSDGALAGLLAGLIGGVLGPMLSMGPVQKQIMERVLASNPDIPDETRRMLENMNVGGLAIAFKLVFSVCVGAVFGMLGGLLGVAFFKKKDLPPPGTVDVLPPV